jgi:hypothetical protein
MTSPSSAPSQESRWKSLRHSAQLLPRNPNVSEAYEKGKLANQRFPHPHMGMVGKVFYGMFANSDPQSLSQSGHPLQFPTVFPKRVSFREVGFLYQLCRYS